VPLFERNRTGARPTLAGELANGFLSDLLGAYHRQFSNVDIKLEESTSP